MLSQMVFIHITLLLLDPHDIHHEGKNVTGQSFCSYNGVMQYS